MPSPFIHRLTTLKGERPVKHLLGLSKVKGQKSTNPKNLKIERKPFLIGAGFRLVIAVICVALGGGISE
jgi:hypothetical protein